MSRLCVKNIPKHVKEDRLRDFFSQKGEVTDAKLMRTKDGKSRQFAFIGFRTEEEAQTALNYFNNSYLDTCRMTCEIARKAGDPNIPRPWSRYSSKKDGSSNENVNNRVSKLNSKSKGIKGIEKNSKSSEIHDPQLQEFLQIMHPQKSKIWANDTLDSAHPMVQDDKADEEQSLPRKVKKKQASQAQIQAIGNGKKDQQLAAGVLSKSLREDSLRTSSTEQLDEEIVKDDVVSDMDYFKSRVKKNWSDSETDDEAMLSEGLDDDKSEKEESDAEGKSVDEDEAQATEELQQQETEKKFSLGHADVETVDNASPESSLSDEMKQALRTGRLFVRNLPYTTNEEELVELFSKFGDVSQAHVIVDKDTKRSKGIAYVLYTLPDSAVRALEELDNSIFQGRLLHIMPAKPQHLSTENADSVAATAQEKKTLKQQREEQRKASEASGDTRAWNALFMRSDTVVENIARKHGVSKSDFLDREADDLAVRIALGETHVIAETKKALSNAGINIVALEEYASKKTDNVKRSNQVILVKNLPYSCCEADLANMFGKFGSLDKIILPPTKVLALVIFLEAAEARAAFKGLAYKRYKDAPLYLEWASGDILVPNSTPVGVEQKNAEGEANVKGVLLEIEGILDEDIDLDRVESRSVFVKNLNFTTSDEGLKKHFSDNMKSGSIKSVKIKRHIKKGKTLSMGFGFIEFDSVETATNACKNLQGTVLDGHSLILQLCHAKKDDQAPKKNGKDRSSTKLIVRNVAFEATEKDLRQLFSPFGQIKSLRLPMKLGRHRGFAFVEFVTKQEAQNALQALSSTHLYGRHLVLERAKEGESLEELRERTASQFVDEHSGYQKLSKKRKLMSILDEGRI